VHPRCGVHPVLTTAVRASSRLAASTGTGGSQLHRRFAPLERRGKTSTNTRTRAHHRQPTLFLLHGPHLHPCVRFSLFLFSFDDLGGKGANAWPGRFGPASCGRTAPSPPSSRPRGAAARRAASAGSWGGGASRSSWPSSRLPLARGASATGGTEARRSSALWCCSGSGGGRGALRNTFFLVGETPIGVVLSIEWRRRRRELHGQTFSPGSCTGFEALAFKPLAL